MRLFRTLILGFVVSPVAWPADRTALDRYIETPDPAYRYEQVATLKGDGVTAAVLDMTSQNWLTSAEVDRTLWQHWVTVIQPAEVKTSIGLLFIGGGANDGKPPGRIEQNLAGVARETGSVVTELRMVPNQPLVFGNDGKKRSEDDLIAYAWDKFLRTGSPKWLPRLPMTKSAVRAMDTVTDFCRKSVGITVDKFVVAGGSKRGWTTWTTAAVDKRVVAIAPIVIDLLNVVPSFQHHWRVYGFWSPAIKDYELQGIMNWTERPEYRELLKVVEPFEYRDRLTMPKLIMNSSGDQFFLPDSSQFYFDQLKGEKFLRYVPNSDHSLRNTDAYESLLSFFGMIVNGARRPRFSWKKQKDGSIHLGTHDAPREVRLWQATNSKARDFRLATLGPVWKSSPVAGNNGIFLGKVEKPAEGFTAFFLELTYPGLGNRPLKLTTEVSVVPDVYPHTPFKPDTAQLPPVRK